MVPLGLVLSRICMFLHRQKENDEPHALSILDMKYLIEYLIGTYPRRRQSNKIADVSVRDSFSPELFLQQPPFLGA